MFNLFFYCYGKTNTSSGRNDIFWGFWKFTILPLFCWCLQKRDSCVISRKLCYFYSPCGCGDLSIRLGSRIGPHCHRVVVEVHWRDARGWRSFSWVVATFSHVGGSFNLLRAATGDVWMIPSFRIWGDVLHVEHISCVITNCGQHHWAIPSVFSVAL